jgi:hypothetical protein
MASNAWAMVLFGLTQCTFFKIGDLKLRTLTLNALAGSRLRPVSVTHLTMREGVM